MNKTVVLRLCKVILCLTLAVFALVTGLDNILDYESNYRFVVHTLAMDTVFPETTVKWRAITNPALAQFFYGAIIIAELITGVLLLIGSIQLARTINENTRFDQAKSWVTLGCTLGVLLWFGGFMVVGGEWFKMWQSETWNGTESAFRFTLILLASMIFVGQPEDAADGNRRS